MLSENRSTGEESRTWGWIESALWQRRIILLLLLFGLSIRIAEYVHNRSLWLDEASLALNVVSRSLSDLCFLPLENNQAAPLGFLMIEKLAVCLLGNNEYALRLFPLLSGLVGLCLAARLATQFLSPKPAILALALIALSPQLVYYSSEAKQYSVDVLASLSVALFCVSSVPEDLSKRRFVTLALVGSILVWFSYPIVFVLAGFAFSSGLRHVRSRKILEIGKFLVLGFVWAMSFSLSYVLQRRTAGNVALLNYWWGHFAPFPPVSPAQIYWYIRHFFDVFGVTPGLSFPGLAAFVFIVGCGSMRCDRFYELIFLVSPLLFVLVASMLHLYPFYDRLLLFVVPFLMIVLAQGIAELSLFPGNSARRIAALAAIILLLHPALLSTYTLIRPRSREEIRPILSYVKQNWREGDIIYVHRSSIPAFTYYQKDFHYPCNDCVLGTEITESKLEFYRDMAVLEEHPRAWLLFSHVADRREEERMLAYLNCQGRLLDYFVAPGNKRISELRWYDAKVFLFDLREEPGAQPAPAAARWDKQVD